MNRMRLRLLALALTLAALIAVVATARAADTAAPLALRAAVTVEGSVIRLADLFDGAVENGHVPVAKAPAPGRSVTLDARWLASAARLFKLDWRPASRFEQVVVTRASILIGPEAVKNAVSAAIADAGAVADISAVQFQFDPLPMELEVPADGRPGLAVRDLVIDERSRRFSASVVAPADGPEAARTLVSGRIVELTEVPVLTARMLPGEVIGIEDLLWAPTPSERLASNVLLDPAQIVGKTPRRPVRAGQPLLATDLERSLTIRKGSVVMIRLQSPQMVLTVQGRALEDGAEGQVIKVANIKSDRVLHAVVQDASTVVVAQP